MTKSITERIIKWNKARNGLAFDPNLEMRMLSEEANEFYHAETFAHKLQEYADFLFVWEGTKAKYYSQKHKGMVNMLSGYEGFYKLRMWKFSIQSEMEKLLFDKLTHTERFIYTNMALDAVITANEAKTSEKDENGKVIKGDNYVSPLSVIEAYLAANGYDKETIHGV